MGRSGMGRGVVTVLALLLVVLAVSWVLFEWFQVTSNDPQTTFAPRSDVAALTQDVYLFIFWIAAAVFVFIMLLTLAFSLMFRERPGREALQIHGNTRLEVLWTVIPVLIVVMISVPTFDAVAEINGEPPDDALQVVATGHQWWFEFEYPELGLVTANEIHLPVDRPVEITLLSNDVIHSFWVPQLAGKTDMVPGHENRLWFTPNEARDEPYLGQCAEFCGLSHANMRFYIYVDEQEDFEAWAEQQVAERVEPTEELAQAGEEVFGTTACIGCHAIRGTAASAEVGPDLTHVGSRATIAGGFLENTPEEMARWIRDAPGVKPGAQMPSFEGDLTEEQIEQLVAYLQSLE